MLNQFIILTFQFHIFVASVTPLLGQDNCGVCLNNGTCITERCICTSQYTGIYCETFIDCGCMNQGTCLTLGTKTVCICSSGFYGDRCEYTSHKDFLNGKYGIIETPVFNCTDDGCENGGTCLSDGTCLCDNRFTGEMCDQRQDFVEEDDNVSNDGKLHTNTIIVAAIGIVIAVIAQCICCVCLVIRHKKATPVRRPERTNPNIVTIRTPDGREFQGFRPQWCKQYENTRRSDDIHNEISTERVRMIERPNDTDSPVGTQETTLASTPPTIRTTTILPVQAGHVRQSEHNNIVTRPPTYEEATSKYLVMETPRTPPTLH